MVNQTRFFFLNSLVTKIKKMDLFDVEGIPELNPHVEAMLMVCLKGDCFELVTGLLPRVRRAEL